tara:strand:+ start:1729 stop:2094 length:366 start_codon:yes stop_codon:yes gene_type:complete
VKLFQLPFIISLFFIYSCASDFYQVPIAQGNIISIGMIQKLETGLTKTQVQYIMGTPSVKDPFKPNQWDYIGFEIIGDSLFREVHHSLIFEDNKLKTWKRKLDSSSNDEIEKEAKKLSKEK